MNGNCFTTEQQWTEASALWHFILTLETVFKSRKFNFQRKLLAEIPVHVIKLPCPFKCAFIYLKKGALA